MLFLVNKYIKYNVNELNQSSSSAFLVKEEKNRSLYLVPVYHKAVKESQDFLFSHWMIHFENENFWPRLFAWCIRLQGATEHIHHWF